MYDNALVHTVRIVKRVLEALDNIEVMDWLPYLSDLNSIENIWTLMKVEIYCNYLELETVDDIEETLFLLIKAA